MRYFQSFCVSLKLLGSLWLLFFTIGNIYAQDQEKLNSGLYFYSGEVPSDERTSLNLTPDKALSFGNGFTITFEAKMRQGDGYYGNILKILSENNTNFGLVANMAPYRETENVFWVTTNDSILASFKWSEIGGRGFDEWILFELKFESINSTMTISINGCEKKTTKIAMENLKHFEFVFGKVELPNLTIVDVCPMSVKNIELLDGSNSLIRSWPLNKHGMNGQVFDEVENSIAVSTNPKWLVDKHLNWKHINTLSISNLIGSTFDNKTGTLYFADERAIVSYSLSSKNLDTLTYTGFPLLFDGSNLIYHPELKELWSFSIDSNMISSFDFNQRKWDLSQKKVGQTDYWHSTKLISGKDGSLLTFGGYGHYEYRNTLHQYQFKENKWSEQALDIEVEPRYLSSSGPWNEKYFLIFGGFGSATGQQINNPRSFYDLFAVDYNTFSTRKLWAVENPLNSPFVPVNSLINTNVKNSFYTLVFNNTKFHTYLKLVRIGVKEFHIQEFPDSIPYTFHDVKSHADLVLSEKTQELVAYTIYKDTIKIFSRAFPPLLTTDVVQHQPRENSVNCLLIWLSIGLAVISGTFILYRHKILKSERKSLILSETTLFDQNKKPSLFTTRNKIASFYLFGGFQVFDNTGNDITGHFTPTLKHLFLLIFLSKVQNGKGISSQKLREILWHDKSFKSAKNNRNVNISKLRNILNTIGDISIRHKNTYWQIELGVDVFCDIEYTFNILEGLSENTSSEELTQLFHVLHSGEICPDIQTEWMDKFKEATSTKIIDSLEEYAKNQDDPKILILLADIILINAPLSEPAIRIKCLNLCKIGKKGLAKKAYDKFCQEHFELLDDPFEISFNNLIT